MADLSAGFDFPNPFGLLASDMGYDLDAYTVALRFLGDLATGTDEQDALEANGGSGAMLRAWEGSQKFRRVLAKCRAAGRKERAAAEKTAVVAPVADGQAPGTRFVPLDEVPLHPSVFSRQPRPGWPT